MSRQASDRPEDEGRPAFEAVCEAMGDPAFYPHPMSRVERRDTHISAVFLTGEVVYKVKKPVDLGFLDFRRLEDRRTACMREDLLNRRLSRDVYRGVVPIHMDPSGAVSLETCGPVVEYAVTMRQLPDAANLKALLAAGAAGREHVARIGRRLAGFYGACERSPAIDAHGGLDAIACNMEENFRQLAPWAGRILEASRWEFLCEANRAFLTHHAGAFARRVDEGRIRDGHGDLRTDHVYFDGGLQIIDCIEFNDRFRFGDAAADIAFLVMDLAALGHADLGRDLLAAYAAAADDPGVFAVVDFYVVYRAVVRIKVACLRLSSADAAEREVLASEIDRHMDLAYRHTLLFGRPTLWVCCGVPASGKSSLAGRLGKVLGIRVFGSDIVRKETAPDAAVSPYGRGAYSPERRSLVYGRLLALAQDELRSGRSAVLDATYALRRWRDGVRRLAEDMDASLVFAVCACARKTLSRRLTRREQAPPGPSDARIGHLDPLLAEFEDIEELPKDQVVHVDTDGPREENLVRVLTEGCARRASQIARRLR
ncbi:AAA family ATPase [Desulfococcus sp.]|uniref:bifunctional aminoglycoside phosphotransferase/ATP-binding protein n=1 Tax=Desulfococcus sp. TaxID=2025834 RepID=UPI0035947DBC